ncbi:Osa protein, partial [Burkholderia contaminans]
MLTRLRIGLDRARDLREAGRPSPIQPRPLPSELVDLSPHAAHWRVGRPGLAQRSLSAVPPHTAPRAAHPHSPTQTA